MAYSDICLGAHNSSSKQASHKTKSCANSKLYAKGTDITGTVCTTCPQARHFILGVHHGACIYSSMGVHAHMCNCNPFSRRGAPPTQLRISFHERFVHSPHTTGRQLICRPNCRNYRCFRCAVHSRPSVSSWRVAIRLVGPPLVRWRGRRHIICIYKCAHSFYCRSAELVQLVIVKKAT